MLSLAERLERAKQSNQVRSFKSDAARNYNLMQEWHSEFRDYREGVQDNPVARHEAEQMSRLLTRGFLDKYGEEAYDTAVDIIRKRGL